MSTSMLTDAGIELTDVPPRDDADAVSRLRRGGDLHLREPRDRARHRKRRVDDAERAVAVAAGPREGDAIALAADAAARDYVRFAAVDRQDLADAILVAPPVQQELDPAQIPFAFLADVADEEHVARGLDLRRVHGANERQQQREAPRVVAHAWRHQTGACPPHGHVGAGGKHGVEMCVDHQQAAARRCPSGSPSRCRRRRSRRRGVRPGAAGRRTPARAPAP